MSFPNITVAYGQFPRSYELQGFEESNAWMLRNCQLYQQLAANAKEIGMTEIDTLRYMLIQMSNEAMQAREMFFRTLEQQGIQSITDDATLDAVVANYTLTEVLYAFDHATCKTYARSNKR